VVAEIGDKQSIQVSQDELKRALIARARSFPGQERFVYEYYEKNPAALVEIRGPPVDKKVSVEELLKPAERDDELLAPAHEHHHEHGGEHGHDHHDHGHDHGHDHDHGHAHHHGHGSGEQRGGDQR
jgi:trigger factor